MKESTVIERLKQLRQASLDHSPRLPFKYHVAVVEAIRKLTDQQLEVNQMARVKCTTTLILELPNVPDDDDKTINAGVFIAEQNLNSIGVITYEDKNGDLLEPGHILKIGVRAHIEQTEVFDLKGYKVS